MKKKYKIILFFLLSIGALLSFLIALKSVVVRDVFYLVFLSFIIAYTLKPIQLKLVMVGIHKRASAVLIIVFLTLMVLAVFLILIPSMFRESLNMNHAVVEIENYMNDFAQRMKPLRNNKIIYTLLETLYEKGNRALLGFSTKIFDGALNLGENLITFAVMPILVYYFLADSDIVSNRFFLLLPAKGRGIAKKIVEDIDKVLGRYIISQFILCILVGGMTFFILVPLKVEFPIMLSILNAIFNIIPYFGPLFGAIPAIIMALLQSSKTAIWVAIWLYMVQQVEGNLISPKITGDSVSIHPFLVIILLIVGGKLGGFLGMVLAIPLGVIIKIIYEDLNYYIF